MGKRLPVLTRPSVSDALVYLNEATEVGSRLYDQVPPRARCEHDWARLLSGLTTAQRIVGLLSRLEEAS